MNSRLVMVLVLVAAAVAAVFLATGDLGGKLWPGADSGSSTAPEAPPPPAVPLAEPAPPGREAIARLLAAMPAEQRRTVLEDPERFARVVEGEAAFQALLKGARDNGLHENENVRLLMRREAEQALVNAYLRQLARVNIGGDFPTEEQLRQYFENNRERFTSPERVHLWQIFWPVPAGAGEAVRQRTREQAEQVLAALRAGEIDFEAAAAEHSGHRPSKLAGGYMGLLNVRDLLPEVGDAVLALEEGGLSGVIATDSGLHIVRKGSVVGERSNPLADVREQVRASLLREANAEFRRAAGRKAVEAFDFGVDAERREAWRRELMSRLGNGADASP